MDWERYDKKYYVEPDNILQEENDCLKDIILGLDVKNKKCLDFGCGSGYWTSFLLDQGADAIGTDILLGIDRGYPFAAANGIDLPFADLSFDVILASWVFQEIYVHSIFKNSVKEIYRVLKNSGNLVIVENIYPDKRVLCESSELGDIFKNNGEPPLLRFFPDNSALRIMENIKLKRVGNKLAGYSFFEIYRHF